MRPALLSVAFTLSGATALAQPAAPEARVGIVHNRVEVVPPRAHTAPLPARRAARDELLAPGTGLVTHADSEATVRYAQRGELQVEPDTHLVLFGPPPGQHAGAPEVRDTSVTRGAVRVLMAPGAAEPIALHTPGGTVHVLRGEARVHVDASHATRVAVYRGRVRVSHGPRGFLVGQGTATRIDADRAGTPAFPPVPVPRAPVWTAPFPPRVLAEGGAATAEGAYAAPPAQRHPPVRWVQTLARDAAFDDVVFEREVPAGDTRFVAAGLPEGEYFARVASVNAEHIEGLSSPTQRFAVVAPRVIPAAPGRRAEVLVPEGLTCVLDDMSTPVAPGVPFPLAPARAHELRCSASPSGPEPARGAWLLRIPAEQAGEVAREVRLDTGWSPAGGASPLAIRLRDASGRPLPYATITARGPAGVVVDPVREEAERGLYVTDVRWPAGAPLELEFTVNDALRFTERFDAARPR